jgi:hypothetical protein
MIMSDLDITLFFNLTAKIIIIFNEKAKRVPEIYRKEINDGFVIIWQLDESLDFFSNCIETKSIFQLKNTFENPLRLKEKFAPHLILKKFNQNIVLNNITRKPTVNLGHVSISHCKNFVAVAYNPSTPIGIDIEYYGDRILKILHKFLDDKEAAFCNKNTTKERSSF